MRNNILNIIAVLSLFAFCSGCANWTPNWQIHDKNTQKEETVHLLESAREIRLNADTKEDVNRAIHFYKKALETDASNYEALTSLSQLYILNAAGYTNGRSKKNNLYQKAITLSEWAMYTNPDFKTLADDGQTPWEASTVLTVKEMDAMFFWVTAILYRFKECMSLPNQILNIKMIQWIGPVLEQMKALILNGVVVQFSFL